MATNIEKLKYIKLAKNLDNKDLAKLINVERTTLWRLLNNEQHYPSGSTQATIDAQYEQAVRQ